MKFTNSDKIAHISNIQTDPYVWYKEGLGIITRGDYQENAYMPEAILQVRGKGADTAKVTLGYNDGYNGIAIAPDNWYNFEIIVETGDAETGDAETDQTITLTVTDLEDDTILGVHSAKFDADFTGTTGTAGNNSFSGDTEVDKLTSLTGIEFFMNSSEDTTNYFDNINIQASVLVPYEDDVPMADEEIYLTSTDPYYMFTIDNDNNIIYDYGQLAEDYISKIKDINGNMALAEFVGADGTAISGTESISGTILRMRNSLGQFLDYYVEPGTDTDLLEAVADGSFGTSNIYNPDYEGWYEYTNSADIVTGSAMDASFVLGDGTTIDQRGFITRSGENFVDQQGNEIEFWGTNIGGNSVLNMTKEELERAADRIAKAGYNLVRIHAIDQMSHRLKDIYGNVYPGSFWQGMYSINEATGEVIEQYLYPVPEGFRHMTPAECQEHWHKNAENVALDEEGMDKLCYFIAELKERGVYYWMDLMAKRGYYEKDKDVWGIEAKFNSPAVYYNENIQAGGKDFSKRLLTWHNPYTNSRLVDDPSLVMIGMNNENSLQGAWLKLSYDKVDQTNDYYDEICRMYADWLSEKYVTREALQNAWGTEQIGDSDNYGLGLQNSEYLPTNGAGTGYVEVLNPGNVDINGDKITNAANHPYPVGVRGWGSYSSARANDVMEFLTDIMVEYMADMTTYLRGDEVGAKCAITGNTTWGGHQPSMTYGSTKTDFIDLHKYHAHPNGGWSVLTDGLTLMNVNDEKSFLEIRKLGLIGEYAEERMYNYPLVISEWNNCPFNMYESEGLLLMSAYGKLNGWTPINFGMGIDSDYFQQVDANENVLIEGPFSTVQSPIKNAAYPSASIAFLRGDVTESSTGYYNITPESDITYNGVGGQNSYGQTIWPGQHNHPSTGYRALIGKTGVTFDKNGLADGLVNDETIKTEADAQYAKNGVGEVHNSNTDELMADMENKVFTMNTSRSQAVTGFIQGDTISLDSAVINVTNPYATITITSIDDASSIENSNRILLTTMGKARNYGQIISGNGRKIIKPGADKVMVEQIVGSVKVNITNPNGYKVYSLNSNGSRKAEIPFEIEADGILIPLTVDLQAMNFEIVNE